MHHSNPDLGQLVNHVARLLRQAMSREAAAFGLTAQQAAVILLVGGTSVSIGTIAGRLGMDRPTMTGVAERLVRDGWADLRPNPADGRSRLLQLTPRALAVLPQLASSAESINAEASRALTPVEANQLTSLLGAVSHSLESANSR